MGDYDSRNPHGTQSFDPFFSSQENPGVKARPSTAYPRRSRLDEDFASEPPAPEYPPIRDPYVTGSLSRKFDAYSGSVTPSGNLPPNEDFNSYLDAPPLDAPYHPSGVLPEGDGFGDAPYNRDAYARPYAEERPPYGDYAEQGYNPEYQRTTGNLGRYGLDEQGVPYGQPPTEDMYADPNPTDYYPENYAAQEPMENYSARLQGGGWEGSSSNRGGALFDDGPSSRRGNQSGRLLDDNIEPRRGGRSPMFDDELPNQRGGSEPLFADEPLQHDGRGGGGGLFGEDEPVSRKRDVRLGDSSSWKMPAAKGDDEKNLKGKKGKKGKNSKGKNGKDDPPPYLLPLLIGLGALLVIVIVIVVVLAMKKPAAASSSSMSDASSESIPEYDLGEFAGTLLPQTEDAGQEYITDTLFIGDSNTLRMSEYSKATKVTLQNSIGVTGMGVGAASTSSCVYFVEYNSPISIPAAVKLMQPQRIVLMYGTNDLVGKDAEDFISNYKRLIAKINEAFPAATIVVASILPVTKANQYQGTVSMQGVIDYNKALAKMAQTMEIKMLNWTEVLLGKNGYCDSKYMIEDGIHVSEEGFKKMFDYFRTHSYITEDTRTKPLAKIPTRKAAPPPPSTASEGDSTGGSSSSSAKTISVTISSVIDGDTAPGGGTVTVAGVGTGPSVSFTYTKGTPFPAFSASPITGFVRWICTDGATVSGGQGGGSVDVSKYTGSSLVIQAKVLKAAGVPAPTTTPPPEESSSSSEESIPPVATTTETATAQMSTAVGVIGSAEGSTRIEVSYVIPNKWLLEIFKLWLQMQINV